MRARLGFKTKKRKSRMEASIKGGELRKEHRSTS